MSYICMLKEQGFIFPKHLSIAIIFLNENILSSVEMKPNNHVQKKQEEKARVMSKAATPPAAPASAKWNIVPESVKLAKEYHRLRLYV